jgi:hypothetical protein
MADGNRALSPEEIEEWRKKQRSTEDIAFMRLGETETADQLIARLRRNQELGEAMKGVVDDARRRGSPLAYPGGGRPKSEEEQRAAALAGTPVASAPPAAPATGWREAAPLLPPPGVADVDRIAHALAPHGVGNPEYRGPRAETALAKAVSAARATPKAEAPVPQAAAPEVAPVSAAPKAEAAPTVAAGVAAATVARRRLA